MALESVLGRRGDDGGEIEVGAVLALRLEQVRGAVVDDPPQPGPEVVDRRAFAAQIAVRADQSQLDRVLRQGPRAAALLRHAQQAGIVPPNDHFECLHPPLPKRSQQGPIVCFGRGARHAALIRPLRRAARMHPFWDGFG